ncbi:putative nad dependent epimerase [Diaporthe ampelina]|uniref:Putative nad dependent epimerase n=1 Tax=Diaporthe ampelina TaxID=1214573 RepID=A0A0G2FQJ9_9PEZI|nr:putative nad dependent epimerase [Diaporthe ampelina]
MALNILGIPTYHTVDAMQNGDLPLWNEALAAKYGGVNAPYDADDWSKILWRYEGIIDGPAMFFLGEWLAQNPEAKVILNKRPFQDWYRSVSSTAMQLTTWTWWPYLWPFLSAESRAWHEYACCFLTMIGGSGPYVTTPHPEYWAEEQYRKTYEAHYPRVRSLVAAERILEFDLGRDGWDELCGFLGKEIPEEPFPHTNQAKDMVEQRKRMWVAEAAANALKMTVLATGLSAVGWLWWQYGSRALWQYLR